MRIALPLTLALLALPVAAGAQSWTPHAGASALDRHRYQVDQHRQAMQQLRLEADRRESAARQMEVETRLRRLRLEAARQPEPAQPYTPPALGSLEAERIAREAATARREALTGGTGQIDAWLDRRPN